MENNRSGNAVRNIFFGIILKVYQIAVPFAMRTMVIYFLGMEYLGLNTLFMSVLQVLNLGELGIDIAMGYCMYRPIAENDEKTIRALMRLFRRNYRVIGTAVGAAGLLLLPFVPKMIKDDVPANLNLYVLYMLYLSNTVLSYWLFAYRNCLFSAHQREDIVSKIVILVATVQYIGQVAVLYFLHSYILYLILALVNQIVANVAVAVATRKVYPQYRPEGTLPPELEDEVVGRLQDQFLMKLGGVLVNSADSIVASAFLGLTMLAVYQNYLYIVTALIGLMTVVFNACIAGIGNSHILESKEKNYSDLRVFTMIICWVSGFCSCCMLCLYQPFMRLWVGESYLLSYWSVIWMVLYFYVFEIGQLLNTVKDAAGFWHADRFRPMTTAGVNLILNVIFVRFWGAAGLILATAIATAFVSVGWLLRNLFTLVFAPRRLKGYLTALVKYTVLSAISCSLCFFCCSFTRVGGIPELILRLLICGVIPNVLFLATCFRTEEFGACIYLVRKAIRGKTQTEV